MAQPQFVAEAFPFAKPASIDKEKGIVYGVRALNAESRNKRFYPESVSAKAVALYSAPCNLGHHFDPRTMLPVEPPPEKRFGRHMNPRAEKGGIVTDFRFNVEHAYAKPFLWAVENDPESLCFSHLARVQWAQKPDQQGRTVAESILEVASIDLVTDGGTTAGIFESRNWTPEMAVPDPEKIVGSLESDGAIIAFLTDLFAKLKPSSQSTKDMIVALVGAAMSGASEAPPEDADLAAAAPAMEHLRKYGGKVGKWAAERLDALFVAQAAAKRSEWATNLIKTEGVAEPLVTPVFVSMVAESFGNDARAKEIIADRKRLSVGAGRPAQGSDRKAGGKSISELVDGYTAG
jgi:hypothetical protein